MDEVAIHEDVDAKGQESLSSQQQGSRRAHAAIDGMSLRGLFVAGIGHQLGNRGRQHLGKGVGNEYGHRGHRGCHALQAEIEKGEVENQTQHAIGANVGVLHDGQDALAIGAASAKAVEEVGQSILVEGARDEHADDDGKNNA